TWEQEPIQWDLELRTGEWRGGPFLVRRDGKPIPAQAEVLERHQDGSASKAVVLFIIDRLEANGSTAVSATFGAEGPAASELKVIEAAGAPVLDNGLTAGRLLNRNAQCYPEFSPLLAVRSTYGIWLSSARYDTAT